MWLGPQQCLQYLPMDALSTSTVVWRSACSWARGSSSRTWRLYSMAHEGLSLLIMLNGVRRIWCAGLSVPRNFAWIFVTFYREMLFYVLAIALSLLLVSCEAEMWYLWWLCERFMTKWKNRTNLLLVTAPVLKHETPLCSDRFAWNLVS
jgi:hypothetical protein